MASDNSVFFKLFGRNGPRYIAPFSKLICDKDLLERFTMHIKFDDGTTAEFIAGYTDAGIELELKNPSKEMWLNINKYTTLQYIMPDIHRIADAAGFITCTFPDSFWGSSVKITVYGTPDHICEFIKKMDLKEATRIRFYADPVTKRILSAQSEKYRRGIDLPEDMILYSDIATHEFISSIV